MSQHLPSAVLNGIDAGGGCVAQAKCCSKKVPPLLRGTPGAGPMGRSRERFCRKPGRLSGPARNHAVNFASSSEAPPPFQFLRLRALRRTPPCAGEEVLSVGGQGVLGRNCQRVESRDSFHAAVLPDDASPGSRKALP